MFKRSISLILSIAMLLSVTSGVFFNGIFDANAAEDVKVTKTLFVEDFQDWEEGIIAEAASDQNSPTFEAKNIISYELVKDNKVEIVKEENGNKYLKITIVSTSSKATHIKYYFPEIYANNKYAISYDFMPETHNKHFERFGSFIHNKADGGDTIPFTTKSYGNDFYATNGVGNSTYYIPKLFKSANYAKDSYNTYAAITQTIDLTKSSGNYEFNAVYPGDSSIENKTVTNNTSQLGIKGLAWKVFQNSSSGYNGSSAGTTSVYRIDNIKVSVECIDVINSSVENGGEIYSNEPVELTFNEAVADNALDYVSVYKNGALASSGDYALSFSDDKKVLTVSGFAAGAEYSVKIDENLKSQDGKRAMKEAYQLDFSTVADGDDSELPPDVLFVEDFEGFKEGIIKEPTAYVEEYKNGLYYALYPGDKLEIAKDEESGNKYLKLTRGSDKSNNSYVMYAFPEAYTGGVISVSYDYKPEAHSQCFDRFGTLSSSAHGVGKNWSTDKKVVQHIVSYGVDIYTHSGTNGSYWIGGMNNISKYAGDESAVVKQTVDFTSQENNYKFNATLKNAGTKIGSTTRTVNTADINSIAWAVKKNTESSWNGSYKKEGDPLYNSSVYRIDNIVVKREVFGVSSSNIKNNEKIYSNEEVKITFEEAVVDNALDFVSVYKNGNLASSEDYTLSLSSDKTVLTVSGLKDGFDYKVKIDKAIKSASGKVMKEDYELIFKTIGVIDLSDSNSRRNPLLHYEDFEDYNVGVIYDATEAVVKRIGSFYIGFFPGDKLEIAEENGNKYLKLTRTSDSADSTYVTYLFPDQYKNGKVSVSYDFRPDNNDHYFERFGTLTSLKHGVGEAWSSNKPVVQQIVSYLGNHYVHSSTDAKYYVAGLGNKTKYAEGAYATINQKIDLTQTSNNYTFSATYPNATGGYTSPSSVTRNVSATDINGISWSLRKHTTPDYNGPDTGVSVYRIDNIVIEDVSNLADGKKVLTEDFEGYSEKQYVHNFSFMSLTNKAGHKFEVATDPVTNSKALKATIGESTDEAALKLNFGKAAGKTVKLSFDMRFANHSRLLRPLLTLNESTIFANYRDNLYWKGEINPDNIFANYANICNYTDVQHFEITVDPNASEKNVKAVITRDDGTVKEGSFTISVNTDFEWTKFTFKNGSGNYVGHNGQSTGDGVYWIDNVRVELETFALVDSSVEDGQTITADDVVDLTFSGSAPANTADYVSMSKNDVAMSDDDYVVTLSNDNKTLTVSPKKGYWDNGSEYKISVGQFEGAEGFEGATLTFKTEKLEKLVLVDNFEDAGLILGGKQVGPATINVGNITVELQEGDSIEYAYDDVAGKYGFKLTKGDTTGSLKFDYVFPQVYKNGKYRVKVSERIANHSKGHVRWPALISDADAELSRAVVGNSTNSGGYWLGKTGSYSGVDRFGASWSSDTARWIGGYTYKANNIVWGELTCGLGYKYGTYNETTGVYESSIEPANTAAGLKAVRMLVQDAGTENNYGSGYLPGKDEGDDVSWIYGITVERMFLEVESTSFEEDSENLSISESLEIKMTERLDTATVNTDTVKLLRNGVLADDYTVSVSDNKKVIYVNLAGGLEYNTDYTISLSKDIKAADAPIGRLLNEATYDIHTAEYVSEVAPAIVASTIANGANDVSFKTNSVVLTLNDVLVSEETITKSNVRLYKEGVLVDSYSVSFDGSAIKVDFEGLEENASYRIEVDGITSKGSNPLTMESTYVLNFRTVGDLYVNYLALNLTEETNVFDFTATIFNNTEIDQAYQAFLVVRGNDGTFKNLYLATENTVLSQNSADISIPRIEVDLTNASCEFYVWDSLAGLKALVDKVTLNSIKAGKTVVFAQGANSVLVNGELVSEETGIYKDGDNFVIPAELASKYIVETDVDLTSEDISNLGWGVYVSDEYGFIAVGDDVDFDDAQALETINKFGIFVSPDGDDANAGYASAPVQTLARAVEIYESGNNNPVIVHAGSYRLTQTLNLTSASSGLTIKDFGDGEVKVSGAIELPADNFVVSDSDKIPSSARGYVKEISLSDYISEEMTAYPEYKTQHASTAYYELFSGDVAQTIARWPNEGFETMNYGYLDQIFDNYDGIPASSDKVNLWKTAENGMIAGYFRYNWAFENIYIDKAKSSGTTIKLSKEPAYGYKEGQRYYAMNMLEELDFAGEYYIDNATKTLYYYPTDEFGSVNPELSIMKEALISTEKASNVKISGITFENTRGKGIVTSGGSVSIDNCVLRNIGNNAVSLSSSNSEVVNSHIYSIGGPAITATAGNNEKLTSGNIRIANNEIHNFGRIFRTYQGAIHLAGCGNVAEYNTIYDAPHTAIRFSGSNQQILNNEIYNVVNETSDAGAIYSGRDWTYWGNTIKNNYIHDVVDNARADSSVVAVYADDMLGGTIVENNVIKNCEVAALFGGGRGNIFRNNTVVDCGSGLHYDNRGEDPDTGGKHIKLDNDDSSDTVLEAFVKFIAKDNVVNTMEERYKNYHGFETLVDDVNAYLEDNSYAQIGYPKDAIISGNCFYGKNVTNGSYFEVDGRIDEYGEYSIDTPNSTVPEYSLPDCGIRN